MLVVNSDSAGIEPEEIGWFIADNLLKLLFSDGTWLPVGSERMVSCRVSPACE